VYIGVFIFIVGNFQKDDKKMRLIMMVWTAIIMSYNIFIFSPMWAIVEWSFLVSHILGYYRHHIKKTKKDTTIEKCILEQ
jgi:hypothetical protein